MTELEELYRSVIAVAAGQATGTKTKRLLAAGLRKMAKKVGEEGVEIAVASMHGESARHDVIEESADLLYNLVVLWVELGITPEDVERELARRRALYGIAEKPGSSARDSAKKK